MYMNGAMEFLTQQYQRGLGYESLNTACGALSSLGLNFDGFKVGSHPLVIRYMKDCYVYMFVLNPPKHRNLVTLVLGMSTKFLVI